LPPFLIGVEVYGEEHYFLKGKGVTKKNAKDNQNFEWEEIGEENLGETEKPEKEVQTYLERGQQMYGSSQKTDLLMLALEFPSYLLEQLVGVKLTPKTLQHLFSMISASDTFAKLYPTEAVEEKGPTSLSPDLKKIVCLNENGDHPVQNLFDGKKDTFLESDCDHQLLIFVPFEQNCKIKSITVSVPNNDKAPKTIKIFKNEKNMDFESTSDVKPTQVIQLQKKEGDQSFDLQFVKFQDVLSLTLFVEENYGNDISVLQNVSFQGESLLTVSNIDKLTKVDD